MRNIILGCFLFTVSLSFLLVFPNSILKACTNWCPSKPEDCSDRNCPYNTCCTWNHYCCDLDCTGSRPPPGCDTSCPAGYYGCNRSGGCCKIGETTPTPPPGTPDPNISPDGGGGSCTVTAPTNLTATMTSSTSVTLTWTLGTGGASQAVWVSTNPNPQEGCAGSSGGTAECPLRRDSSTFPQPSDSNIVDLDNLSPNTIYYWEVMNVESESCYALGYALFPCTLSPSSLTINQGQSRTLTSTTPSSSSIGNVTFSSANTSLLTVDPASDPTYIYQTLASAIGQGTTSVLSSVYFTGGNLACTSTTPVTILPPSPWWQVRDSDVQSSGDLISGVLGVGNFFNLDGPGGFPGVTSYSGTTNLTPANVSSTGWLAESLPVGQRSYDFAYFVNQISDDVAAVTNTVDTADVSASLTSGESTHDTNNFYWYKYDGAVNGNQPLTIPEVNIGTRKVILLVDNADVNITGNINLTDGEGFFMLISEGKIDVDPTVGGGAVPNLEGIYITSSTFNTGLGDTRLWVRGSVSGNLGVNMQRDLGDVENANSPSEFFEYAPDLIMLYPSKLGARKINWKEVAP